MLLFPRDFQLIFHCVVLQYLCDVQHLNLGFNQLDCIPVVPGQAGALKFQLTTLILKNNNLHNLTGL